MSKDQKRSESSKKFVKNHLLAFTVILITASFALGTAYGQQIMQEKQAANCQSLTGNHTSNMTDMEPYYDYNNSVCVDPQVYETKQSPIPVNPEPDGNQTNNTTN